METQITDINIPFKSMVWFMVKMTIAFIPTALILFAIGGVVAGVLGVFLPAFLGGL